MNIKAGELILDSSKLKEISAECKKKSKRVVLATGAFDILHPGHLKFLEKSREFGDVLIVGINHDDFLKIRKGESRPIQSGYDRAYLVAGFECVSYVHIFSDDLDLIQLIQPDVFIMSTTSTHQPAERPKHYEMLREIGGQVIVLDAFSTTHTTQLIEKLNRSGLKVQRFQTGLKVPHSKMIELEP